MKIENREVSCKIIDLCLKSNNEYSNLYIEFLNNKIKFYLDQLLLLENSKPSKIQRKKLKKYNDEREEYQKKIVESYDEIEQEIKSIIEVNKCIVN